MENNPKPLNPVSHASFFGLASNPKQNTPGGYVCPLCGASFPTLQHLISHAMTHKRNFSVSFNPPRITFEGVGENAPSAPASPSPAPASKPSERSGGQRVESVIYDDWSGALKVLETAYDTGQFVLIIGPKGTGKTTLVRKFAEMIGKPLYTINFSLRTKEGHLIGSQVLENGSTKFAMGIIPKSMQEGAILYLDELNAAEADVLLRLDEALDDRRELNIKEAGEPITIKAHPDWFVIATINPLSHAGTKELPPQLLSRFPIRIYLGYPPPDIELRIVEKHVSLSEGEEGKVRKAIMLANKLRDLANTEEIYYSPSIRETIAFAKLIKQGIHERVAAELIFANAYWQWGQVAFQKVADLITSIFGSGKDRDGGSRDDDR
jgi:nitric oxide reductase NorQ protein